MRPSSSVEMISTTKKEEEEATEFRCSANNDEMTRGTFNSVCSTTTAATTRVEESKSSILKYALSFCRPSTVPLNPSRVFTIRFLYIFYRQR